MKKIFKIVLLFGLCIGLVVGIYSIIFAITYSKYKKESFQKEIVENLGTNNEKRKFIMATVEIDNQREFDITFLSWTTGARSTIFDDSKKETSFFYFEDKVISIKKFDGEEIKKNGSKKDFLNEVFLLDIDWNKAKCNAKVDRLSLNKKENSLTVNFSFEKDYKVTLQIPSLEKTFIIEDFSLSYGLYLQPQKEIDYTWPTFFLIEGKVNDKKINISYMQ